MQKHAILREYRKKHKYSAQQVADAINVSLSFYYNLENGQRGLTNETAVKVANFYGVSVDSVLGVEPVQDPVYFKEEEIVDILSDLKAGMNEAVAKGLLTEDEKIDFFEKTYKEFEFLIYRKKQGN